LQDGVSPTVQAKQPGVVIGPIWKKPGLSASDKRRIQKLYQCKGNTMLLQVLVSFFPVSTHFVSPFFVSFLHFHLFLYSVVSFFILPFSYFTAYPISVISKLLLFVNSGLLSGKAVSSCPLSIYFCISDEPLLPSRSQKHNITERHF
jgi:hypothetical protein